MKKYSVRPASFADIEQVYALIANQNIHDYGDAMLTLNDLRDAWQNIHFESDTCTAYANGVLEGYGEIRDGDSTFVYLAERNNADLGFQLWTILEEIAIDRKITTLHTRISERNNTLSELALLKGYRSTLSFLIMQVVLDEAPTDPHWTDNISVRTFVPNQDEESTYRLDEEASQDKGYHQPVDFEAWSRRMGLYHERFDPSLWFLACDGNDVIGVALNVYDKQSDSGWVDHLSVRRDCRNRGIGKALLLHTFGEFYRRGVQCIKLRVDSNSLTHAPRLYESVGMKTVQQYSIYKKDLPV
jgi:ribosomal protein S18 acetylase RimI-like enzyme